jgi:hypothetical protein
MPKQLDPSMLGMALIGYEAERRRIDLKIAEIQGQLGGRTQYVAASTDGAKPRRILSPAARKRIAAAQKKRWAAFHRSKAEKPAPKKAAAKRKLSPAAKANLVANLKKARAAKAAKKAAEA